MKKIFLFLIASFIFVSCGGGGGGGGSGSGSGPMDEASARKFAWAVQMAVQSAAPYGGEYCPPLI